MKKISIEMDRMATDRAKENAAMIESNVSLACETMLNGIRVGNVEDCKIHGVVGFVLRSLFPDETERAQYLSCVVLGDLYRRSRGHKMSDAGREQLRRNAKHMLEMRMKKHGKAEKKICVFVNKEDAETWNSNSPKERERLCGLACGIVFFDRSCIADESDGYRTVKVGDRKPVYVSESCIEKLRNYAECGDKKIPLYKIVTFFIRHLKEVAECGVEALKIMSDKAKTPDESKKSFDIGGTTVS